MLGCSGRIFWHVCGLLPFRSISVALSVRPVSYARYFRVMRAHLLAHIHAIHPHRHTTPTVARKNPVFTTAARLLKNGLNFLCSPFGRTILVCASIAHLACFQCCAQFEQTPRDESRARAKWPAKQHRAKWRGRKTRKQPKPR